MDDIKQKIKEKYQTANIKKETIAKEIKEAHDSVRKRMFSYIAAGFGLVVGFAWNDAISSFIKQIFPDGVSSILAKFIYALILTAVVGYVLYYVEKVLNKETK